MTAKGRGCNRVDGSASYLCTFAEFRTRLHLPRFFPAKRARAMCDIDNCTDIPIYPLHATTPSYWDIGGPQPPRNPLFYMYMYFFVTASFSA